MQWKFSVFLLIVCASEIISSDNGCILFDNVQYTRCLKPSSRVIKSGFDAPYKKWIVDFHNARRKAASATKMMKIYWNETLAEIAQKWADQCPTEHDYLRARNVPGWENPIGQNLGYGIPDLHKLTNMWYDEQTKWEQGERNGTIIGHYTQIMNDFTSLIGCGYSTCTDNGYHFVCNYAIGQPEEAFEKPYEAGPSCKTCPLKCVDGLCDCQGRMCFNYGTLDGNTCNCKCHPNFHGDLCEHKTCNATDDISCADILPELRTYNCNHYANIPVKCPFMCGVCT